MPAQERPRQALGLVPLRERIDDPIEIPLEHAGQVVDRQSDAVVGDPVVGEVVGPDLLRALATADLLAAKGDGKGALHVLETAASGRDAPPTLANQLGELLAGAGRKEEAKAAFARAVAANDELAQPHFNLGVLAEEARRLGALLVHYSTDYVFDGTKAAPYVEDDRPNPINVYGASKFAGERAIQASGCRPLTPM